jgi:hypothetical protein
LGTSTESALHNILIAPLVATMRASLSRPVQPLPTLEQTSSPTAGNHGTLASAGQRRAHFPNNPRAGSSEIWERCFSSTGNTRSTSSSQASRFWSKRPVPEAIEVLAHTSPKSLRCRYSPGDIHRSVFSNASG